MLPQALHGHIPLAVDALLHNLQVRSLLFDTSLYVCWLLMLHKPQLRQSVACQDPDPSPVGLGEWKLSHHRPHFSGAWGTVKLPMKMALRFLVFGIQRKRSKPPQPFNLGNAATTISLNSCGEQLMSGMLTFFSPNPTCTKGLSFTYSARHSVCIMVTETDHFYRPILAFA